MKGDKNPISYFKTRQYLKEEKDKRYYPYYGLETYVGGQGKGKTLTATRRIKQLKEKYPKVKFITNVKIEGIEDAQYFTNVEELINILRQINLENIYGYLIFIDEIHVVLAELFGKSDPIFLQFLSQQRKLAIHIIATSQMFNKLPKFIRDYLVQSGQIIVCNNYLKVIQVNKIVNMESIKIDKEGAIIFDKCKYDWFIHLKELYNSYDTFAVITQIQGLMTSKKYDTIENERKEENEY